MLQKLIVIFIGIKLSAFCRIFVNCYGMKDRLRKGKVRLGSVRLGYISYNKVRLG